MSELKFSCPNCGQHMSAPEGNAGMVITCPACQSSVTVPGAPPPVAPPPLPSSNPFTEPALPPIIPGALGPTPAPAAPRKSSVNPVLIIGLIAGLLLLLVVFAVAGLFIIRTASHRSAESRPHGMRIAPREAVPFDRNVNQSPRVARPQDVQVATDPDTAEIPDAPVSGTMEGQNFRLQRSTLSGGTLHLTGDTTSGMEIIIFTFGGGGVAPGAKITVPSPETRSSPHIHLRWTEDGASKSDALTSKYAMRLEFEEQTGNKINGRIYLELPERFHTQLAGRFEATLR